MKLPNYAIKESFFRVIPSPVQVRNGVFLMCGKCPLCNDYKQRMYLKEYPSKHMIYCHNCGYSRNYIAFLKKNYPHEMDNLKIHQLEHLQSGEFFKKTERQPKAVEPRYTFDQLDFKLRKYATFNAFPITEQQVSENKEKYRQYCLNYLIGRKIPEDIYKSFYCFTKGPLSKYIGIPFFDESGKKMIHIQGRRMFTPRTEQEEAVNPKYKFLKDIDAGIEIENKPIWGQWLVDIQKDVIVCEGTLDAPAFENGVATCGASLSITKIESIQKKYPKRIWCIDSFWVDKKGKELTTQLLELGERCFIIPKSMTSKDANDILKELQIDRIPSDIILKNVYEGKIGLFQLSLMNEFSGCVDKKKGNDDEKDSYC